MKFLQALISLILLVVTLSLLSYGMTPGEQDMFVGQFDPLNGIMNILYLLIYNRSEEHTSELQSHSEI